MYLAITCACCCHSQVAKRELRQLRMEARESTKLLEDKKALEMRCIELQATLEVVQNQRNELRQQIKEEKVLGVEEETGLTCDRCLLGVCHHGTFC